MKKCTYCGKEYPDEATACALDEHRLVSVGAPTDGEQEGTEAPANHPGLEADHAGANRDLMVGGLWCAGGIVVTALTYSAASGGGSYVVAWGAIIFGAIQFIRGLVAKLSSR